ncbi:helix-turn-helix transcriptional regulator, partial [Clostridioides difficile]|nr:helix-turn-helix transcriptional regulator [Clostridioides difficile]
IAGMNKYSLLRNFTKLKGITPYRYLENIRVNKAKKLLEKGVEPIDAAIQTGFVDQSHFTNFFKNFIGLTPKQYQNIFINDDSNNFK